MTEFPRLPEHYVRRIVADMGPEEPYYLKNEDVLVVDRNSLKLYLSKFTPLKEYEKSPASLSGRFGIMRIMGETAGKLVSDYVIDLRFIQDYDILQDDVEPLATDSEETIREKQEQNMDLISPIGILANGYETSEEIYIGDDAVKPYLSLLCDRTDAVHEKIASSPANNRRTRQSSLNARTNASPSKQE